MAGRDWFRGLSLAVVAAFLAGCGGITPIPGESGPNPATPPPSPISGPEVNGYRVTEFPVAYPNRPTSTTPIPHSHKGTKRDPTADEHNGAPTIGSTHELTFNQFDANPQHLWITDQLSADLVKMSLDGRYELIELEEGVGPHGSAFDSQGRLWLTFEFAHQIVRVNEKGVVEQRFDLTRACSECSNPERLPGPHGLALGPDKQTLWFAGKDGGYVGAIRPDGTMNAYPLPDPEALPIYITAGPDGNMWFTELAANKIGKVTPDGTVTEYDIPTAASRPIAIHPGPDGQSMWFSEEASNKIGRITIADGTITEFQVPASQPNLILAALKFDADGNLWLQQYINQMQSQPSGPDKILKIASSYFDNPTTPVPAHAMTVLDVPSRNTVMHRITVGPDGNIWFTELHINTIGRITS